MESQRQTKEPLFFEALVSQFDGIKPYPISTQPTISQVFDTIISDQFKETILQLRALRQESPQEYNKEKTTLPGVTLSGVFSHRSNTKLIEASGFASIDIDHLASHEQTQEMKQTLSHDSYIAGCFVSPSGIGIKALIKILPVTSDAEYKQVFRGIKQYLNTTYNLKIDSLPDISRLCFISYDPEAYSNRESKVFDRQYVPEKSPEEETAAAPIDDISLQAALKVLLQKGIGIELGRNEFVGACGAFKRAGIEYSVFDKIMQKTPGYDAQGNFKIWNTVDIESEGATKNTVIWYARQTDKALFLEIRKSLLANSGDEDGRDEDVIGMATLIKNKLLTRYAFRLNVVTDKIMYQRKKSEFLMNDYLEAEIRCWLLNQGFGKREAISDVIKAIAWHSQFHPIRDYLKSLVWDGEDRFDLMQTYIKDSDNIFSSVFASFLVGAVRRIFTGKHHPMMILAGPQQIGKSFFAEWICPLPEYFLSAPIAPETNDAKIRSSERCIWEAGELGATTRKQDIESLKWFITLEKVVYRRAHNKYDVEKPALASYIGTVNEDGVGFLNDVTGYTRWRPVRLTSIDFSYTKHVDVHQLWAQACQLYQEDPLHAHNLAQTVQRIINERIECWYSQTEPIEDLLYDLFSFTGIETDILTTVDILREMERSGYRGKGTRSDSMYLARILNKPCFINQGVERIRRLAVRGYKGIRFKHNDL